MTVVGDPAGMRALADRFAKDASQLRDAAHSVTSTIKGVDASGEWADDLRLFVRAHASRFADAAERLAGLASTLRHSATEVEAAIEAERQRQAAAAAAAELARRQAALRAEAARRQS